MEKPKPRKQNRLLERMVRNEEIFCSLLFDQTNRTLRVIDFRGGNFQSKHTYLERILAAEGMRKIFTLIERDDMNGWQRVGYQREGSIPGYYKRSDAYIMSRIYDADYQPDIDMGEESLENKKFLNGLRGSGKDAVEEKVTGVRVELINESEVVDIIKAELDRRAALPAKKKKAKGGEDTETEAFVAADLDAGPPIFTQFSREVEYYYFLVQNKRTKQANIIGAEYQDCFGNAKVQLFFSPEAKADQTVLRHGLNTAINHLAELGAVSIFAVARTDDVNLNALYLSSGFRNTGWMSRQLLVEDGPRDAVLWTRKLI